MKYLYHYTSKEDNLDFSYSFKDLGRYKRKKWEFQKEWRYIITLSPMGLQDSNPPSFKKQQELVRRLEDPFSEPPYKQLFLEIDSKTMEHIEIVFGPKMNEAEKIMATALMKEYCHQAVYRESHLKIK